MFGSELGGSPIGSPQFPGCIWRGLMGRSIWRVVREVEGATLEMSCPARDPGFESLTLRQLIPQDLIQSCGMILFGKTAENPCGTRAFSRLFVMWLLEGKWCASACAGRLQWLSAVDFTPHWCFAKLITASPSLTIKAFRKFCTSEKQPHILSMRHLAVSYHES